MIQNNNYAVIQGWMIDKLHLKGGELIVYAIIHGFSQSGDQGYTGTLQYLADWTSSTKQSVCAWLKDLVEKGYITKSSTEINNVKFCEYRTNNLNEVFKNFEGGIQKILTEPLKKFELDNTNNNTNYKDSNSVWEGPALDEVETYIKEKGYKFSAEQFLSYHETRGLSLDNWRLTADAWSKNGRDEERKRKNAKNTAQKAGSGSFDGDEFFKAAVNRQRRDYAEQHDIVDDLKEMYL